jgi:hypothetical protein
LKKIEKEKKEKEKKKDIGALAEVPSTGTHCPSMTTMRLCPTEDFDRLGTKQINK